MCMSKLFGFRGLCEKQRLKVVHGNWKNIRMFVRLYCNSQLELVLSLVWPADLLFDLLTSAVEWCSMSLCSLCCFYYIKFNIRVHREREIECPLFHLLHYIFLAAYFCMVLPLLISLTHKSPYLCIPVSLHSILSTHDGPRLVFPLP